MGDVIRKPFNIVRQVNVDDETLKRIAELLGIPEAERDRIISGEIDEQECARLRANLRDYCALDSYGMYAIWRALSNLIQSS